MQVDYFQHNFTQFDLHSTWRKATREKDIVNNGRRLENASWRRFFQQHFHLQRLNAQIIGVDRTSNWLVGPFEEYEALKELEVKLIQVKQDSLTKKSLTSALKRNKKNHHSLTRLVEMH